MDPDAALAALIDYAVEGYADMVREHADALVDWLNAGGFPPRDPRP